MSKPLRLLLIILPLILIILSFHQNSARTNYHMYVTDPEYAYLFNGMTICNLSSPTHVIGPGTPLQGLSAVVIKVVYTFRSTSDTLNVDVMKNPDVYCSAINTFTIILLTISLLIGGLVVYFATKSVVAGLFIQLIPFTKWVLLDLNSRIMVESLIIGVVVLLMAFVVLYIHDDKVDRRKWFDKYILGFAILIGLIASLKFVYLPIAILPFIMLQGIKRKLSYTVTTIVVFFIFSFPILFHWVAFRDWYIDNFFHSGMYGSGQTTIIDLDIFRNNLKEIFLKDKFYLITFIASTILTPIYFIPFLKLKRKNDKEFNAFLGVFITLIILTFLVSKQYKEYYLTVNYLLIVPCWYFILKIISRPIRFVAFKYIQIAAFVFITYFVWMNGPKLVLDYHSIRVEKDDMYTESLHYVEQNFSSETPVLVLADYYGAPFKEYGLYFAMGWSGHEMGTIYAQDLNVLYPNIYFYHGWNNLFNQWGTSHSYIDLLKKYGTVVFYSGDKAKEETLQHKFKGINRQIDTDWSLVKNFENLGQSFYEVKFDSVAANISQYACNAEMIDSSGTYLINEHGQRFEGVSYLSTEFSRSATHSVKLLKNQYGFACSLSEVQKGEQYLIEIWRKKDNANSALVVQSAYNSDFYINTNIPTETEEGWEKLSLKLSIQENMHNKDIKIYCWNFDDVEAAYFDDLVIKRVLEE